MIDDDEGQPRTGLVRALYRDAISAPGIVPAAPDAAYGPVHSLRKKPLPRVRPPAQEMESKHADPEPEAAPAPEPPAAQPAAAPDAAVAADEADEVQVLESPPPRNGPVGAKTAMGLMAAAVAKERAKPAAGVAKPVPAPKRKASIFGKPKRKASIFDEPERKLPSSYEEVSMPDGLSPAMRAAYVFSARTSGGGYDPLAGSGVRSEEDLDRHFERLDQKRQEEIERKKREAARIRAGGGKEKAKQGARMAELAELKKKLEAHMNEEVRKEDERKKKQKRDAA